VYGCERGIKIAFEKTNNSINAREAYPGSIHNAFSRRRQICFELTLPNKNVGIISSMSFEIVSKTVVDQQRLRIGQYTGTG